MYDLPLRARSTVFGPGTLPLPQSKEELQYLAGFFDGDGCVEGRQAGCLLTVHQSFQQTDVLMLFLKSLGGSITKAGDGMGLCQPTLRWTICGSGARSAARLLAPHSITKRRQLLLAADWPEQEVCRRACLMELRALKHYDSSYADRCSLKYFCGFFDAEGYIQLAGRAGVQLSISQKFATVLGCLQEFLADDFAIKSQVHVHRSCSHLSVTSTSAGKEILRTMLAAGMQCKARQAQLAIGLSLANAPRVRAEIAELKGNQRFGRTLDEAGRERARRIARLRHRPELQELDLLQRQHELYNAQHENQLLREYIRKIGTLHGEMWENGLCFPTECGACQT